MNKVYVEYEHNIAVSTTTRTCHFARAISYDYDTENYGFADSRETIEKHLNHRSFSMDFLFEI